MMPDKKNKSSDIRRGLIAGVGSLVLVGGLYGADYASTRIYETMKANSMEPAGSFTPGSYSAEAMGIGTVKATLTFNETNLTDVELDTSQETPDIGGAATETLKEALLEAQSPDIDAIAGATVTSDAVMQAARSAFNQAAGIEEEEPQEADGEEAAAAEGTEAPAEGEAADAAEDASAETDDAAVDADGADADAAQGIYTPGTYTATAAGIGNVTVTLTFDENSITDAELDTSEETPEIGGAATETLRDALLAAQSSEIDAIAGATVTTDAVKTAAADCIAQAQAGGAAADAAQGTYKPGTYTATAAGIGNVTVTLTFDENSITDAELDTSEETPEIGGAATEALRDALLTAQSSEIDAIAGATVTTDAVKTAAADCIAQALAESSAAEDTAGADISGITQEAIQKITDAADQSALMVSDSTEEAVKKISEAADAAVQKITEAADQAARQVADAAGAPAAAPEAAVESGDAVEAQTGYKAGTYTAEAKGIGNLGVTLTVDESGKISDVQIDTSEETAEIGGAAAETLIQEILETQSADIDSVAGATVTSEGIKSALSTILTEAGGEAVAAADTEAEEAEEEPAAEAVEEEPAEEAAPEAADQGMLQAGTYSAVAKGFGNLGVTLTVDESGKISDVQIDAAEETPEIGGAAAETLVQQILESQSADIDGVAGATLTSEGVRNALSTILTQAGGAAADAADTEAETAEAEEAEEEPAVEAAPEAAAESGDAEPADESQAGYKAGTYTAEAKGIGNLGVTLTVDESGKISDVQIDTSEETAEIGGAAAETLIQEILESQSADIDSVAGATVTSEGIKSALSTILTEAGGEAVDAADTEAEETEEEPAADVAEAEEAAEEEPAAEEVEEEPAEEAAPEAADQGMLQAGTYSAVAKGFGNLGVTLTVDESGKISDVQIDAAEETPEIGGAAAETLVQQILDSQSVDIDGVAGATLTSEGVKNALRTILVQAGGIAASDAAEAKAEAADEEPAAEPAEVVEAEEEPAADAAEEAQAAEEPADEAQTGYKAGTYTSYAKGLGGVLSAAVTVTEDAITDVVLDLSKETPEIGQAAGQTLTEAILSAQSADIDGVAGATITSDGVRNAVHNALAQARG